MDLGSLWALGTWLEDGSYNSGVSLPEGSVAGCASHDEGKRRLAEAMRSQNSGEKNLGKEPLEMLLIEIKGERPTSN